MRVFAPRRCYPWPSHARVYPQRLPENRRRGGRRGGPGRGRLRLAAGHSAAFERPPFVVRGAPAPGACLWRLLDSLGQTLQRGPHAIVVRTLEPLDSERLETAPQVLCD